MIEAKSYCPNKNKHGNSPKDVGDHWNVKTGSDGRRKSVYGHNVCVNIGKVASLSPIGYTIGNIHNANCFTGLLSEGETSPYVDSAYQSQVHDWWLEERYIENRIIRPAYHNKSPDKKDRTHSAVVCAVERVFNVLKQQEGMEKARYLGLGRTCFELMCIAHNLKRVLSIQQVNCI